MSDGNREMKESKGKWKCSGNEECLMGSSVDWVWPSKEWVSLKICQRKLPKLKSKKAKQNKQKSQQATQELCDNFKKDNIWLIEILEIMKQIFNPIKANIFLKLDTRPQRILERKLRTKIYT